MVIKTHKYRFGQHVEFVTQTQADNIRRVFPMADLQQLPSVATPIEVLGENVELPFAKPSKVTQTNKRK